MRSVRKILLLSVALCFAFSLCLVLFSCGNGITVSLYDGELPIGEVRVKKNEAYDLGVPKKTGYTFMGWYSEASAGTAYTDAEGKTWEKDYPTAVYAHWEANRYRIALNYCGATALNTVTEISATYGAEITDRLPVPQRTGYSFAGWYTEETSGTQITDAAGAFLENTAVLQSSVYPLRDEGITLYAHWGRKTVTYLFSTGDGSPVSALTCEVGTVLYEMPFSVKDNYCFASWCFDPTMLSALTFPYTVPDSSDGIVTLYACFLPGTVDVLQFQTLAATGDREYEVTYSGSAERLVIPDSYYGKRVTRVKRVSSGTLREIILPQSVKELAVGAFENCSALERINLPFAVETIPERCFSGCRSLAAITLPQGTDSVGKSAFAGCTAITEISLPAGITTVGAGAFRSMGSLVRFSMRGESERYTVKDDVLYCKVGTSLYLVQYPAGRPGETYSIDAATVKIMEYAFSGAKLSSMVIGGRISTIGAGAFEGCTGLVNVSLEGSAATFSIDANAFSGCSNLKAMKIELSKVPTLHATALNGVSGTFSIYVTSSMVRNYQVSVGWRDLYSKIYSLGTIFGDFAIEEVGEEYIIRQYFGTAKEVVIPEILNAHRIVGIAQNAFSFSDMERVTVSQYVREIGARAFAGCTSLQAIVMECPPPTLGEQAFEGVGTGLGIYIKNTAAVLDAYRAASGWSAFSGQIWSYQ